MRFCGAFYAFREVRDPEKCPQTDTFAPEGIRTAFFPVDEADGIAHLEPGFPQRLDGCDSSAAGGHHVLDEAHALALLEGALEPLGRPVVLGLLADDQEWQARGERGRGREGDGAELG